MITTEYSERIIIYNIIRRNLNIYLPTLAAQLELNNYYYYMHFKIYS